MIEINKAFSPASLPISDFFQQPGVAYYIPLYQREYSWETENVEQMMEDIFNGVKSLVGESVDDREKAIHFMGTIILFQESNPKQNIQPRDDRALPSRIDNVIDGQQRISTIALLACVLLQRLMALRKALPKDPTFAELITEIEAKRDLLLDVFSVDIKRGSPSRKPIIVRGSVDGWTFDGEDEPNYKSGVTAYLSSSIRAATAANASASFPKSKDKRVSRNVSEMQKWMAKVEELNPSEGSEFPGAIDLLARVPEKSLWSFERPNLRELVEQYPQTNSSAGRTVTQLVQLFAFVHYFADRCCFTVIKPVSEEWAFDMFQSLNASGTPLTAIETFKPLVVNSIQDSEQKRFVDTKSNAYFSKVDKLIGDTGPSSKKNKLTDEFLSTFALTHDGHALSTQFSMQRRYLNDRFKAADGIPAREDLIRQMGELANYWNNVIGFEPNQALAIEGLEAVTATEKEQSGFCVLFLRESGHRMSNSILSRFYAKAMRAATLDAAGEFVEATKAVAAFYFLWRAVKTNTGLDDVYRKLLRLGDQDAGIKAMSAANGWECLSIAALRKYLVGALSDFADKEAWLARASLNLRYDLAKPMCKFALLLSAHEAIPDPQRAGLMKMAVPGAGKKLIDPNIWASADFKSIEHVAPVKGDDAWDKRLYEGDDYQLVGNLTLLPTEINSSLGKKPWKVKSIYYQHLAQKDPDLLGVLLQEALDAGVQLHAHTVDLLKNSSYAHHVEPIVSVVEHDGWNQELVAERTKRICELSWSRVAPWLGLTG